MRGLSWHNRPCQDWIRLIPTVSKQKSVLSKLVRLCFTNCVYVLWQERNKRIFQNSKCNTSMVVQNITSFTRLSDLNENILNGNFVYDLTVLCSLTDQVSFRLRWCSPLAMLC